MLVIYWNFINYVVFLLTYGRLLSICFDATTLSRQENENKENWIKLNRSKLGKLSKSGIWSDESRETESIFTVVSFPFLNSIEVQSSSETQGQQLVGTIQCPWWKFTLRSSRFDLTVNFHHKHCIVPTKCPWVSEDEIESNFLFLLINKYTKHKLMIIRCQSQRLIWHRSESYNVLQSYNENKN